jgi:hypothetical protein
LPDRRVLHRWRQLSDPHKFTTTLAAAKVKALAPFSLGALLLTAGSGVLYFYFRSAAPPVSRLNPSP